MSRREDALRFWAARSGRERAALAAAAAVLAAALLYGLLLAPALEARAELAGALPRLRAQLAQMHLDQRELAALRKQASTSQLTDIKALMLASAAGTAFARAVEALEPRSAERATFALPEVAFDEWLAWVEALQRSFGVRLERCRVTASSEPGFAAIEATFVVARAAPAR